MFHIIYLKGDMFCIILDIFRPTDFSFYLFNQFDWQKMTYTIFTFIDFIASNHG